MSNIIWHLLFCVWLTSPDMTISSSTHILHYFVLFYIWVIFLYDWLEIKPVNSKGNQPWILTGRTVAEVESPILWPSYMKRWRIGKDLDAGKDWRQKEKGVAEHEMVRQYHQFNGREFEQKIVEDRGAWHATVHEVTKSQTRLRDWKTIIFHCIYMYCIFFIHSCIDHTQWRKDENKSYWRGIRSIVFCIFHTYHMVFVILCLTYFT